MVVGAGLRLMALLLLVKHLPAEFITRMLGEKVSFSPGCAVVEGLKLQHLGQTRSGRTVAVRSHGVWTEGAGYAGRVERGSEPDLNLTRLNYNDNGFYEFSCSGDIKPLQLEVLFPVPVHVVAEETARVPCFSVMVREDVNSVRWDKDGELLMEASPSGTIAYGSGHEGRATLDPDWLHSGDLTLSLGAARLQDAGIYSCSINDSGKKQRGNPAAMKLTVSMKQTDPKPRDQPGKEVTENNPRSRWFLVAVISMVLLLGSFGSGWMVGRRAGRCGSTSSGFHGGEDQMLTRVPENDPEAQVNGHYSCR